ncbi:MAG: single-stranded-DNA-specific exonuclease RecJ [Planctomycetota bacterium]|nr:MAG: single-stranded-DNA-specific exonuclease RecJ [Planctomycetota bacterium]
MRKRWKFAHHDRALVEALVEQCDVSPIIAQLLVARGLIEPAAVRSFLHPKLNDLRPPEALPGLPQACRLIMQAIAQDQEIVVYGDYDADGMTATAILYRCIQLLGGKVTYYLPDRLEEGYGLHAESLEKLAARGRRLVITVDCGVASVAAAARARELGLTLIITDHHQYGPSLPEADAIVHPGLPGTDYPFAGLCGAGVAFKLAWGLCQAHCNSARVTDRLRDFLVQSVGLAAIGTIADVVPLIDENRILVRSGLEALLRKPPLGVAKLMELTQTDTKRSLDAEDVAFMLAPRLNAAGRLGQAPLGVELLVTEDAERADALAKYIVQLNASREKLERSILLAANKQIKELHQADDPAFVLASDDWHPGVIGIVAGKLAERHHRPVVLVAQDKLGGKPGTGSARSPNGVDLHAALQACHDLLVTSGGHAAAAGLKIDAANLAAFRMAFMETVAEMSAQLDTVPELAIDAETVLGQIDLAAVEQMQRMGPFGMGNPRPLLCTTKVHLAGPPKMLGESGKHMAVMLEQSGTSLRAVAFGTAEHWFPQLEAMADPIDVVFRPVINDFRGFRKVELHLVDWRPHSGERPNQVAGPHRTAAAKTGKLEIGAKPD